MTLVLGNSAPGAVSADVVADQPTGAASVDGPMLAQAISDTPIGGVLLLRGDASTGPYAVSSPLVINKAMTLRGKGLSELFGSQALAPNIASMDMPLTAPYLAGSVIKQVTAATDGIQITAAGMGVHLENIGVIFDSAIRWTNTGHGVKVLGPTLTGGTRDSSIMSAHWKHVAVYGHDGNHYGFDITNPLYCTLDHLRSWGGGLLRVENNNDQGGNYGNLLINHLYGQLCMRGSASGVRLVRTVGFLNLIQFNRPQISITDKHTTLGLASGTVPDTSTQQIFNSDLQVYNLTIIAPDFESNILGAYVTMPTYGGLMVDPGGLIAGVHGGLGQVFASCQGDQTNQNNRRIIDHDLLPKIQFGNSDTSARVPITVGPATVPRQRATEFGIGALAFDPVAKIVVGSDGTYWSDVATAPTISTLGDIANLAVDANVDALGLTDGADVTTLTDASGNGKNFTSGGGDVKFKYRAAAVPGVGRNAMESVSGDARMVSTLPSNPAAFTDFIVCRLGDASAVRQILSPDSGAGVLIQTTSAAKLDLSKAGTTDLGPSTYALTTTSWYVLVVRYDGSTLTYRANSSLLGTPISVSQTFAAGNQRIGNGSTASGFLGKIARYARYSAALTDTQVLSVEKLLTAWAGVN